MKTVLIEIKHNDECKLIISINLINGTVFYDFNTQGGFEFSTTLTFIDLKDSWNYLKHCFPLWYQMILVQINPQITELIKKDFIMACDKNEHTIDNWLVQLFGIGLGF